MAEYPVNRGIGKPVEFKGLKSQYLFIFAGGLLAVFVVFIVLFMAGACSPCSWCSSSCSWRA